MSRYPGRGRLDSVSRYPGIPATRPRETGLFLHVDNYGDLACFDTYSCSHPHDPPIWIDRQLTGLHYDEVMPPPAMITAPDSAPSAQR